MGGGSHCGLSSKKIKNLNILFIGNSSHISEMYGTPSKISMILTPLPHVPFPLIQQISFCSFKSSQSHLLKFTCTASLSITWKSIFRRGRVLQSHSWWLLLNELSQFFSFHYFIWSFQLQAMMGLYKYPLTSQPSAFPKHMFALCKPCSIKSNLIVTVDLHAVHGYVCCHTYAASSLYASFLLFHSATTMQLHHVILLCQP